MVAAVRVWTSIVIGHTGRGFIQITYGCPLGLVSTREPAIRRSLIDMVIHSFIVSFTHSEIPR